MIQLLIKANTEDEARGYMSNHFLTPVGAPQPLNGRDVMALVDDECWRTVAEWFSEDLGQWRPHYGFPAGSLLHFTYRESVPT